MAQLVIFQLSMSTQTANSTKVQKLNTQTQSLESMNIKKQISSLMIFCEAFTTVSLWISLSFILTSHTFQYILVNCSSVQVLFYRIWPNLTKRICDYTLKFISVFWWNLYHLLWSLLFLWISKITFFFFFSEHTKLFIFQFLLFLPSAWWFSLVFGA